MQKYHIIEFQAYNDGRCAIPTPLKGYEVNTKEQEDAMVSEWLSVCSIAAISAVDAHTVGIYDSEGKVYMGHVMTFRHGHEAVSEA